MEMLDKCENEEHQFLVVIASKNWFMKNTIVHGRDFTHPNMQHLDPNEFRRVQALEREQIKERHSRYSANGVDKPSANRCTTSQFECRGRQTK
jgi:hypothetical protein